MLSPNVFSECLALLFFDVSALHSRSEEDDNDGDGSRLPATMPPPVDERRGGKALRRGSLAASNPIVPGIPIRDVSLSFHVARFGSRLRMLVIYFLNPKDLSNHLDDCRSILP